MSYGMFTVGSDGALSLHTDAVNSLFYKTAGTYAGTASIPASNFLASFGVATPVNPVTWQLSSISNYITVCGAVASDGSAYYQPSPTLLATTSSYDVSPTLAADSAYVHSFGSLAAIGGYGFFCKGPSSLAVSPSNRAYCVHPNSSGQKIRSSTATSLVMPDSGSTPVTYFSQPTGPNIYFDQAYVNPPLIFITASSGPIAMNYMNRDTSGRYVSASIVAESSFVANTDVKGYAYYGSNTYSFSYFIVSDEPPVYGATSAYGIRVFDATGVKMYDSTNFTPNFINASAPAPYRSLDADGYYRGYNGYGYGKAANQGVCINACHAFTGYGEYQSYQFNINTGGPISFFGRYLQVTSTAAYITGCGTGAFLREWVSYTSSFDFIKGSVPNINFLFASYYV